MAIGFVQVDGPASLIQRGTNPRQSESHQSQHQGHRLRDSSSFTST